MLYIEKIEGTRPPFKYRLKNAPYSILKKANSCSLKGAELLLELSEVDKSKMKFERRIFNFDSIFNPRYFLFYKVDINNGHKWALSLEARVAVYDSGFPKIYEEEVINHGTK